jgi:hypothetical protein
MTSGCELIRHSTFERILISRRGNLGLVSGKRFTLVGTPQGRELKDPNRLLHLLFSLPGLTSLYRDRAFI